MLLTIVCVVFIFVDTLYEKEIEYVLSNPGEDRPGKEGSRVAIG